MHEMEEGVRSGGGSVKKKNSSGCLVIKKKGNGTGRIRTSGSRKVYESNKKKKRSRMVLSDSESSDEWLEPFQRKIVSGTARFRNGSLAYREDIVEDGKFGRNSEIESERKRRLDVFEFDEYDGIYGKRMRKDYVQDRFKHTGRSGSERQFEAGYSRHVMIDKRKHFNFDSTSNSSSGRKEGHPDYTVKSRFEIEDDEAHLPISSLRHKFRIPSDEPVRLQGKNGVLKVMVNKKKMELPHKFYDNPLEVEDGKGSKSENAIKKNLSVGPSFYSDSKRPEKTIPFVRTEKSELKLRKPLSVSAKSGTSETEDSDTSLRLRPTSMQAHGSSKGIKHEGKAPSSEKITPVRGKEGKVKWSYGTEKQLLREKIRNMLVSAGWTIDYRPRRNRDYLDAVYINPTGTAYWSIIKAYDALQKQLEEEEDVDIDPSGQPAPFTPLPEELLSKLTRQTRKKLEKEMKMKRRDNHRSKNVKGISMEETAEGMDGDKDDKKLSFFRKQSGKSPKGRSHETTYASGDDSTGTLYKGSPKQERADNPSSATNSHMLQARKSRKIGRCTLLVRSSAKGLNSESNGHVTYMEKRTLLSWLIDSGIVHLSEKVQYMNRRRTRVMLEGWITRDGIHCACCSKILTVSKFEIHAGSKLRQPFQNIYLESGVSLLQCQIDAWNRQGESKRCGFHTVDMGGDDPNDDTCGLCGDGGDLICCDGCPSTFHQSCLGIQMLPPGDWHCPNCTCKFCGVAGGSSAYGNGTPVSALLTCSLCWKKYHESCSQEMGALPADSNRLFSSFCGQKCRELFDHLQKLLGVKNELDAGFSWSLIHRTDLDTDASHRGFPQRVECNSKLAVALSVMDECFLPIVDRRSRINLIHNVLYNCGSNFSRLNYVGFCTAILERGDEIISAASIRIHGTQLAEMPFIGTRHIYRRQGMCRRLFCAIESTLCSLKVEKLIIPAIAEHMHTWTVVFGFNPLEESHKQEMRSMNMLMFPGTDMLHKLLVEQKTADGNITANSGAKSVLIRDDHELTRDLAKNSDVVSSSGHDLNICDDASLHNANEMNDKTAAEDSGLEVPAIPSKDNSCLGSSFDDTSELKLLVLREDKTTLNSQSIEKLTDLSADLKHPPFSDGNHLHLEIKNSILYPSVMDKSSAEGVVDDVHEANVQVSVIEPVHELLDESSIVNTAEGLKGDQNFLPLSTMNGTDETTKQLTSDVSPYSAVDLEREVERVEGNILSSAGGHTDDAHHRKIKVSCAGPVLDSVGGISAQNTTETINENQDPVSVSSAHGSDECIVQLKSDLNQPDALGMESKLNVVSQVSDAEVASDARIALVEGNVLSSAVSDSGDAHETHFRVGCVEPVLDSFGNISGQHTTEEMNDNRKHVSLSTFGGTDESFMRCNFYLNHQSTFEVEREFLVASEVSSEAEVVPVNNNIESSAVGNMDDTHEVNGEVACVEPDHDCFGEISTQNKDINKDQDPVSVSSLNCSDHSTMQLNSDWKRQSVLEKESNLHAASEVAFVGSNILSNAEGDMGKDSLEVNVINACAEPVLKSSGETSVENATKEGKAHVGVSAFHGSDGSTVQFESDRTHLSATEMETELHMDSEVPSDAMHCLRNI